MGKLKYMNIITLDFETYYSKTYGLTNHTMEEYIRSEQFEVIGVSTKVEDGEIKWVTGDFRAIKKYLNSLDWANHLLLAQNCAFDAAILKWKFGIEPAGYLDTMSMAHAMHGLSESSSLANLAKLYNQEDKGTAVLAALGKHRVDFTPEELADYGDYCKHDTELTYNIFHLMMKTFPEAELRVIDLTIRMYARPVLMLDAKLLITDLSDIRAAKRGSLLTLMNLLGVKCEADLKKQLMSNDKFAEMLKEQGVAPPTKISPTTGKETWAFAKTDEDFTDLMDGGGSDSIVATMVATRLENRSTILESRTEAFSEIAERGSYPFSLTYSGAKVTHRWSGFGTNPQNLPRGSTLRRAIMAPSGFSLVVADLSNIELRLGLWMAKQLDAVQQIRDGVDLYRVFASEAFNIPYKSIGKDSIERFVGKVCHLSLLYQTGAPKLKNTIRIQSKGKITITDAQAERFKSLYREKYVNVVNAWRDGEDILEWIAAKKTHTAYGFLPVLGAGGIIKPSGLLLPFPGLAKGTQGEWTYNIKRGRTITSDKAYGGKCFQRCVQSLARDIMAEHAVKINKLFYVAGLVHDEVICVVRDDEVEEAKLFIKNIMRTPPAWAADLPLDCEVGSGKRYGDAK